MEQKPKVVKRSGRWVIVPPPGYYMPWYIRDEDGGYSFSQNQARTMEYAREDVLNGEFKKERA